jgi:chorismate synthase
VKGVAIGEAWDVAGRPAPRRTTRSSGRRSTATNAKTNTPGGLEGGMTNGQPLSVRAAIKPISTLTKPLRSVDTETKAPAQALRERTDSTVGPGRAWSPRRWSA